MDDFLPGSAEAKLAAELHSLLRRDYMRGETSALIKQEGGRVLVWFMAVSTGMLGLLLATISLSRELNDPTSLSRRLAGADADLPRQWQYELRPTRFPVDNSITFTLKMYMPIDDMAEVVQRLRGVGQESDQPAS